MLLLTVVESMKILHVSRLDRKKEWPEKVFPADDVITPPSHSKFQGFLAPKNEGLAGSMAAALLNTYTQDAAISGEIWRGQMDLIPE